MFQSAGDVLSTTAVQFHSSTVAKLARSSLLKLLRSEAAQGTIQSDSDFNLAVGMWIDSAVNALGGRKVQS
jgi:hypothetical protein